MGLLVSKENTTTLHFDNNTSTMEALRFRTPSPNGHGSIGSSTAASSPSGFDAHFHGSFTYFGNNSIRPTRRGGAVGASTTGQRRHPSLRIDDRTEDITVDLLRYINDCDEHNNSERTKHEAGNSSSIGDGPSDFTGSIGEWMAGRKAVDLERLENESPTSPMVEVAVTPEASLYSPEPAANCDIETNSELPYGRMLCLSPAAKGSGSISNLYSPEITRYPTPTVEDSISDFVSSSPSFDPGHIAVSSPDPFWQPRRKEVVKTTSSEQGSNPFADFSEAFHSPSSASSSPSNFMANIFNREREMMLSQLETLSSQVRSLKLRSEQAESSLVELQSVKSELEEWKHKGDEFKDAKARLDFMSWENTTLKRLLTDREKITCDIATQKIELEAALERKEKEASGATTEIASLRRRERESAKAITEMASQKMDLEAMLGQKEVEVVNANTEIASLRHKARENAKTIAEMASQKMELEARLEQKEEVAVKANAEIASLKRKEKECTKTIIEMTSQKAEFQELLGRMEKHNATLTTEIASQKTQFEETLRRKEEENAKATDEATSQKLKFETALRRKEEKNKNTIAEMVLQSIEYEAELRQKDEEKRDMAAEVAKAKEEVDRLIRLDINKSRSAKVELGLEKRRNIRRLNAAMEEVDSVRKESNSLRTEVDLLKARNAEEMDEALDEITLLKTEVNSLRSTNATQDRIAGDEITSLRTELSALNAKVGDAESENARINALRTEVDEALRTKEKELETAMRAVAVLNADVDMLKKENAEDSNKANARLRNLCLERDSLKMELETSKKQSTEQNNRLLVQVDLLRADVDTWMSKAERQNSEITPLKEDLKDAAQENSRLAMELEGSKRQSKEQKERFLAQIRSLEADIDMWMSEAKHQEERNSEIVSLKEDLNARIQDNGRLAVELESSKRRSTEQNERLLEQIESLGTDVDMWMSRAKHQEKQNSEIAWLKEDLEAGVQENDRLRAEIRSLRHALEAEGEAGAQADQLKEEVRHWKTSNKTLKEKLRAERSEKAKAKKENEQSNRELRRSLTESMKSRENYWKEKVDTMKKEREVMAKVLMHQWGREECGYSEPQLYRYKYVKRA
ncbi:hypothetical protein GP486_000724 [Trichoglossum hirsutum]|uniref:Uncharacterized protein n=1 Tax=Trichoglossum hirsutum TaxID=265104 RepID=A0A9P8LI08_9PEZI|nr:hypothetical protein GP486_000724 [Trichoglossum hirsutum]